MQYKKIEATSYNLHLIKTNKFKVTSFKFIFRDEIKKKEITIRNVLLNTLFYSSKKYNTKRKVNIKRKDLYDLEFGVSNSRIGNHIISSFIFHVLDEKYSNNELLDESVDFMKEILFNPNIINGAFTEESVNIAKDLIKADIISNNDYPSYYTALKLKETMDSSNPFSYNISGYLDDLEKINSQTVTEYYNKFINNSIIDIYIVGNIDFYEVEKLIRNNFIFKTKKKTRKEIVSEYIKDRKGVKKISEKSKFKQTNLAIGCSFDKLTEKEKKYTMIIYNNILGTSPESKLFTNVREKKSLAYRVKSNYLKNDNVLIITAGIESKKSKLAIKTIKEQMKEMAKGNFSDKEINESKEIIISSLKEFDEYSSSIIEYYFAMDYLKIDNIERAIKEIKSIKKDEIIAVAKKIKLDTIYLLEETNNETN